jgi:hypothetical protein
MWNRFTRKWATPILVTIWTIILTSVGFAFWKIYKTSREVTGHRDLQPAEKSA